jgi:hypothetical protein
VAQHSRPPAGEKKSNYRSNRACVVQQRMPKATLLAMLGDPASIGESYSDSQSRAFFEKIPEDNWEVVSFDPSTRKVCVEISDDIGTRTVAVTLPYLTL